MEKGDLKVSENTVVHCPTVELARKVVNVAKILRLEWSSGKDADIKEVWEKNTNDTCIRVHGIGYGDIAGYKIQGYDIISAEEFLKLHQAPTINTMPSKNDISAMNPNPAEESVLLEANRIINGDRQADYGDAVANFKHIASVVNTVLRREDITPDLCCMVHIATKLCREGNKHKRDNLTDLAAYSEILNQIKENK